MMAGCLFSLESLIFNALLQTRISGFKHSKYNFEVTTAQNGTINPSELKSDVSMSDGLIRQINAVKTCNSHVILFNFSTKGDIDSGTVAEFMIAKSQNIPAVCWRVSAFSISDTPSVGWNLMVYNMNNTAQYVENSFLWHNLAVKHVDKQFNGLYNNSYNESDCQKYVNYLIDELAKKLINLAVTQYERHQIHPQVEKSKAMAMWYPGDYKDYYQRVMPEFLKQLPLGQKHSTNSFSQK